MYSLEVNNLLVKHQGIMENSCKEPKNEIVSEKLEASCFPCKGTPELRFPCPPLSSGVPITICTVP